MEIQITGEMQTAIDLIQNTDENVFLTGKAGSGKTTFLQHLLKTTDKECVVVAPTGVAAVNAGGMTIHSFLSLPFGVYRPTYTASGSLKNTFIKKASRERREVIDMMDVLVIDEISMVRADLLDAISEALCHYRQTNKPFGGVQLLMVGDLHQLPPVVKPQEWDLISDIYETPYFFSSLELQKSGFETVELTHIFRQSDPEMIEMLNSVRAGQYDAKTRKIFKSLYNAEAIKENNDGAIVVCALNRSADKINYTNLKAIDVDPFYFHAIVSGTFPDSSIPCEKLLTLKVGAQVMCLTNVLQEEIYNGSIGTVLKINNDSKEVTVQFPHCQHTFTPTKWSNNEYVKELDEDGEEIIAEQEIGSCVQLPLKLAWAITIHKSQGLTFDNVIVDAANSFTHGQVYVALSRATSLEGLKLYSRIGRRQIMCDDSVREFYNKIHNTQEKAIAV